jgi:isoleucyl-tRNA synthetase
MTELDHWALARFAEFRQKVLAGYEEYEFHSIFHGLHNFCGPTMSNRYLDVLKDRLYTSPTEGNGRRAAQTVLYTILDGLIRLMAPILSFTAVEAWEHLHGLPQGYPLEQSVFFADFPEEVKNPFDQEAEARWEKLLTVRGEILQALELARREKIIGHPLEAEVLIQATGEMQDFFQDKWELLKELAIVSELGPVEDMSALSDVKPFKPENLDDIIIGVRPAPGTKCERCWIRSPTVGDDSDHPEICDRCVGVVTELSEAV